MAYSLNPKDLREELKTYKQPVYVASTQPAQQSVAPASTSPYRQQKRSDGGTDFYNGNQKTTIEEFSKGTGNQVDAVRGNLAAGGSKFDQDVLTKQYFETKDPEVTKFNTSDVYSQRQRIADLQGLAGRTKFNSQEDIKNRDWAQQQLANIETYGKKQGGNPLTFAQDAVAAAPSAYKRIGEGFGEVFGAGVQGEADKAQADYQQGVAETVRNLTDNMNKTADPVAKERYKQAISNIAAQSDLLSAQQEATQTQVAERTDPTKAAGAVASIGLDVVTAGAGSKLVGAAVKGGQTATAGSKLVNFTNTVLNPQTIRQGAVSGSTLGAAYGGAGTAEQMGADATLQDYASGIGTGAAIGAVTGAAIPATIKAGQVIGDATTTGAKNVARAVENINPQVGKTEQLTIYRGGKPFDPNLVDSNGASFTTLEKTADYYRGGTKNGVKETYTLAPDTKILNVDIPPSSEMDKFALVSKARNEGYDAIRFGGTENEIRVLNADKVVAPQVTKTPKQPPTQKSAFEADLEAAGLKPTAQSKFARTVQRSQEVSDPLKAKVKEAAPTYEQTTNEARTLQSEQYLKSQGINRATTDIKNRLQADKIDDQTVSDAIATAKQLDAKGSQKSLTEASEIYERLAEHLSKAGQTVQAAAILTRRTPEGLKYHAQKMLKKAGVELTPERQAALNGYIKEVRSSQDQLNKLKSGKASKADIAAAEEAASIARENVQYYIATQIPEKLASKLVNFWRAGLLTAPTTTGGAILGNTETLLTRKLWTNPAATMADWVMSAFTGKRTQSLAKTGELAKGAVEGAKALNGQYWKTGRDAMLDGQRLGKYDQPNQKINYGQKPLGRAIGGYVNGVYSLMGAVDKPFRYGAYRESLSSQARAAVDTMRLQNKKINRQEARKLYNDMMENPSTEMKQRATDEALYETFQNKTIAGELIGNMKQWAKREGHSKTAALMDFLMPFTGVPSAIAARVIQRTPIGTANEIVKQIVNVKKNGGKFDQRAMARAIGEGTAGIPVIAAGAALAGSGMITGGYPRDEKTRNEWEQTGKQPNSVKIGDQWYSLNYLQPFGTLLAIGSAIGEKKLDEGSIQDIIVTGASTAANSIVSMSFLDGISNALSVVTEGASESSVGRFVGNTAASVVPNFIRSGTRAADDVQRDTKGDNVIDTAIKSVAGALPGTRQLLPAKTDQFGQPLPAKNNFVNQFLNPLRPSQSIGQDDPSVQELSRLLSIDSGVKPTEATKATFKDHELKYSEIKELNQLAGPKMKEEYDKLVQSPEYAALSDEDKVKALKKVNDTVFGAVKTQWGYDKGYVTEEQLKDLNSNQRRYAQGNGANYITGGIGDTKLDSKSTAYKFLDSKPEMTDDEKATWSQSEASEEYRPMVDEFNSQLPEGLPKVPYTNKTAELLSEFQKAKADSNWSKLELNDKTKDLAINTYKAQLTDNEQFITTLSDADIVTAADSGEISREELDRIIAIDDITTKLGGSQIIGNKTRKLLGYGTIASKSGGSGGSGKKRNYKLNAFGDVSGEVSGNLRKLIEQATIKGV